MGSLYLVDMANWLRDAGLSVIEYGGWQSRARGSGGYDSNPLCVMWHHTASPASWDGQKDADYCAVGHEDSPIANLYIDRSGTVWVLAGGASNTNGKGKSISFSRGTVPADGMNSRALGIEMGNDGIGERWPRAQIDSAFKVSNTCNHHFGNRPDDMATHQFYAPDRKIDPATCNVEGPWIPSSVTSSGTWNRADVQAECNNRASSIDNGDDDDMANPCTGIWQFEGEQSCYALYSTGYKVWLENPAALAAFQSLMALNGVPGDIKVTNDRGMMQAFGPIMGPIPPGVDKWGVPT